MKARKSKLDPFAEALAEWETAQVPLAEMQERLREKGCSVSLSRLSGFLESQRERDLQSRLLDRITSGARQVQEVEKAFAGNPPPEIETLLKLHRVLILKLSTQAELDPKLLGLVNQMMRPVLDMMKLQTAMQELHLSQEKFALLKRKADQADAARQVVESTLTPEEQRERLREILK